MRSLFIFHTKRVLGQKRGLEVKITLDLEISPHFSEASISHLINPSQDPIKYNLFPCARKEYRKYTSMARLSLLFPEVRDMCEGGFNSNEVLVEGCMMRVIGMARGIAHLMIQLNAVIMVPMTHPHPQI